MIIILYLLAIILANFSVYWFGTYSVVVNAFLFIGLDLTARDKLHKKWKTDNLVIKMGLLIISGSLLTWILNKNTVDIAIASALSFFLANVVDTIVYYFTEDVTKSNIASATVDSICFPWMAFGSFMLYVTLGQLVAKVIGGYLWLLILKDD